MKKLHIYSIMIVVLLAGLLSACGSQAQSVGQVSGQGDGTQASDGSQAPGRNVPDLYGEVKSVSGNEISLALIEMPQQRFNRDQGQGQPSNGGENRNSGRPSGDNGQRPSDRPGTGNRPDASGRPDAGNGPNTGSRPGDGGSPRQGGGFGGFGNMPRNYTGENVTIVVTEDTPITAFERGNGGTEEKKLTLQDLKEGSLLQVWYKKDSGDKKEVESIRLIPAPAQTPETAPAAATGVTG